jgi:ribosomal protein L37E
MICKLFGHKYETMGTSSLGTHLFCNRCGDAKVAEW